MFSVSDKFDSGNIRFLGQQSDELQFEIKNDNDSAYFQWFHFSVSGARGDSVNCCISNAGQAAYVEGWPGYRVCASYDRKTWHRLDTEFDGQNLRFKTTLASNTIWFAYFEPYSQEQHLELIARAQLHPNATHRVLGKTIDDRDIDLIIIGEQANQQKPKIWITARQHPGESMAEHLTEGLIDALLDGKSPIAKSLREKASFYIIPNMNPDGSVRGHLRTNAAGANLNREWLEPSLTKSPEVYWVRAEMLAVGGDAFFDIHGDEALPYNFVAASEGVSNYDQHIAKLEQCFKDRLLEYSDEFQTRYGYDIDEPGQANTTVGSNWMANEFKTLALTLEMPFKDNANKPCEKFGWSAQRSRQLGVAMLSAIHDILPILKRD